MNIIKETYKGKLDTNEEYDELHSFLVKSNNEQYTYARFDWMMTNRSFLDSDNLDKIGIWKTNDEIVATVLYDHSIDAVYPIYLEGYEILFSDMLDYIENVMGKVNKDIEIFVRDNDHKLKEFLVNKGYRLEDYKETVMRFDLSKLPSFSLPKGFTYVSLEDKNYKAYSLCLFKGFDHESNNEKYVFNDQLYKEGYERKHVNSQLKVSISDSNEYIAHCGMWYDKNSLFAVVEPVCVIPRFRNKSFGKLVVYEGLRRVKEMGAKYALVGSDSPFYKQIGFEQYLTGSFYRK